jgi:hypothetical protein
MSGSDDPDDRSSRITEFRVKVLALLNSDWPPCAETDPETVELARILADQLQSWESWGRPTPL